MFLQRVILALVLAIAGQQALAQPQQQQSRVVIQPVMQYLVRDPTMLPQQMGDGTRRINPFLAYTHLGTDFGFHGPGERFISWENGRVCIGLIGQAEWGGMWHSLSGMASSANEKLDFLRYYPSFIADPMQPEVIAIRFDATGSGQLKLEIKSVDQKLLWTQTQPIADATPRSFRLSVNAEEIRDAKFLTWTAEPGSGICINSLQLVVDMPAMDLEQYVLLTAYAKLADCYCPATGLVRDRAHVQPGDFDSMPATGYFALATAAMADPTIGIVAKEEAKRLVRAVHSAVAAIPHAKGLLPHFTKRRDGQNVIHPGTEFSTVDTAIYSFSMLLAAEMLDDPQLKSDVLRQAAAIDFKSMRGPDGRISHGLRDDGQTPIPFYWGDWGGETALVMLLERLAQNSQGTTTPPPMQGGGRAWQGTGFITEIQSLFFPDFDRPEPDNVSHVSWLKARQDMLQAQKRYLSTQAPESPAAKLGLYGFSAGEGVFGATYEVNGVDLPGATVVHPHYILMAAALEPEPQTVYQLLRRMDQQGYLTTFGLVENVSVKDGRSLPMIGSLNAGFETLGAYHLQAKARRTPNTIYAAAQRCPEIRRAMRLFYPN
jgi:hypothetical protein